MSTQKNRWWNGSLFVVHLWIGKQISYSRISSVQLLSRVQLFVTPWSAACQACLPLTITRSLHKFMFIELVMLSSHLILWCPLLFLPSIYPSIRNFPNESSDQNTGVSASVLPVNIQGWSPLRLTGLISLLSKGLSGVFSSTTVQRQ